MSLIMNEKEFVENIYFWGFCLKNIRFYKLYICLYNNSKDSGQIFKIFCINYDWSNTLGNSMGFSIYFVSKTQKYN